MRNIVLIGFMGTGKTTTGKMLANRLHRPFVDVDRKIEQQLELEISQIFEKHGEHFFRDVEKRMVAKVSRYTNTVIATGGGVVLSSANLKNLRMNGIIVLLTASLDVIYERTERRKTRPLLECEDKFNKIADLLAQRQDLYNEYDLKIDTSSLPPAEVVEQIILFLRQGGYLRGRG